MFSAFFLGENVLSSKFNYDGSYNCTIIPRIPVVNLNFFLRSGFMNPNFRRHKKLLECVWEKDGWSQATNQSWAELQEWHKVTQVHH